VGRHPLWADRPGSRLKQVRIADSRLLTMHQAAGEVGCALTTYFNLETRGVGTAELWSRAAATFGVPIEAIRPVRAPTSIDAQLSLQWASSSS
jgi:hypothetical protein